MTNRTLVMLLALFITAPSLAVEYAWKCPDGAIQLEHSKSCLGAKRIDVENMNAAELNAYVKAQRVGEVDDAKKAVRQKLEADSQRFREEAGMSGTKGAECRAAFAGKPPVTNSGWDGSVLGVEHYLQRTLKDPDSYKAIEWSAVLKLCDGYAVRLKYRAKNSFGGYVINHTVFTLNPDGVVTGAVPVR